MAADNGRELNAVVVTGMSSKKMSASVTGAAPAWPLVRPSGAPQALQGLNIFAAGSLPVILWPKLQAVV